MWQLLKNSVSSIMVLLIFTFASGCALTRERAQVSYIPQTGVAKIEKASVSSVTVEVLDSRTVKDKVSTKKNSYGMEMAAITLGEDATALLKRGIEAELENRGFPFGVGNALVLVELTKFYNDFKVGFFAGDAVAELLMTVQVKDVTKAILYSKNIVGGGLNSNVMLASGENARIALDAALKDAIAKLFQDPQFLDSIIKAGRPVEQRSLLLLRSNALLTTK